MDSDDFEPTAEEEGDDVDVDEQDAIDFVNTWLDEESTLGSDINAIRDGLFTTGDFAAYWDLDIVEASAMRQAYRNRNYWMDESVLYVVAHEGHYGPGAPWRLLGTRHEIPEATRRVYRLNQIRHLTWELYDHAKKEIKSFGAENRQALVMIDLGVGSVAAQKQRLAMRDYARDMLNNIKAKARADAEVILNTLGLSAKAKDEYYRYLLNGFWPYVEVMADEELAILESIL